MKWAVLCTSRSSGDWTSVLYVLWMCFSVASAADAPFYSQPFERTPSATAMTALGRAMFRDPLLSASGQLACATCHNPTRAFGPSNGFAVQRGGRDGRSPGVRAVPTLMYGQSVPPFNEHFVDDDGDDGLDQGPAGGRTWDGRAQSAHEQARLPLLSTFEMANRGPEEVVAKVQRAAYAELFRETFGERIFANRELAFDGILMAFEAYQQDPAEFYPYSSKYDAWLRGQASLSAAEQRGLATFDDPTKGNCARCHPSGMRRGALPQFSDFGYAAIAVPRNAAIPANQDSGYVDLGLCGPLRGDLAGRKEYCGMFRTPTLRNVALRPVFFHNGVVHRLEDAVRFYAERDTRPQRWYARVSGVLRPFDDLPPQYWDNLDRAVPFDRHMGDLPPLSDAEIGDIVAFLKTLTDGYDAGTTTVPTPPPTP